MARLEADIPHSVKGFTVATSAAAVVDRGTRFDVVARDDGGTDVVTYEGAVDVETDESKRRNSNVRAAKRSGADRQPRGGRSAR